MEPAQGNSVIFEMMKIVTSDLSWITIITCRVVEFPIQLEALDPSFDGHGHSRYAECRCLDRREMTVTVI